jgi:LysM repeat protein
MVPTVECPGLKNFGNLDNFLDPGESVTCAGSHSLTQADLDARAVTNAATASAAEGSILSAPTGITVNLLAATATPGKTLKLTKTANPLTYNQVGQPITYTYVIENTGSLAIGPVQFAINDDHISGPFPCGPNTTLLNPGQTISCVATYTVTQQDMGAASVTNTATATGGDAQPSAPVSATITNSTFQGSVTPGPSNLVRGTTVQHQVVKGEWMIQIARCYGVDYQSLRDANLQISDPSFIEVGQILTVPNIGSAGPLYGPPCVVLYTVVAGDTWNSIATRYNARLDVLQEANPNGLVTGALIKVPINSAGAGAALIPVTGTTSTNTPVTFTPTFTPTVTSTPTFTPTGTLTSGAGQPIRITIPAGSTTASVNGGLVSHETVSYVVAASQGQVMTVSVSAPANEIAFRISDPTGIFIKQLDGNLNWTGILPAPGDYRIDLVGLTDPNKNYILTVTITGP